MPSGKRHRGNVPSVRSPLRLLLGRVLLLSRSPVLEPSRILVRLLLMILGLVVLIILATITLRLMIPLITWWTCVRERWLLLLITQAQAPGRRGIITRSGVLLLLLQRLILLVCVRV